MLKRLSARNKILLMVLPSLLYMTVLSSTLVLQSHETRVKADQLKLSARYFVTISQLVQVAQKERGLSAGFLAGRVSRADLNAHRSHANEKIEELKKLIPIFPENLSESTMAKVQNYLEIRAYVDGSATVAESTKRFSDLNESLILLLTRRAREFSLNGLENRLISLSIFEMAKENAGRLRAFVSGVLGQNKAITVADTSKMILCRSAVTINLESNGLVISAQAKDEIANLLSSEDWNQILHVIDKVIDHANVGQFQEDPKAYFDTATRVIDRIAHSIERENHELVNTIDDAYAAASKAYWFYLFMAVACVTTIGWISILVTRNLVITLNSVTENLSQSVSIMAHSSEQLTIASNSLSSGVTEQAAALQQTAASLEEVRAMVTKNAEGSRNAQDLAEKSNDEVKHGKDAVTSMLSAVAEIHRSNEAVEQQIEVSNRELTAITQIISAINEKTKVINDIVFQTKLLSFNASVEAARAGEHGKGFAVVAEEVGNLANMSGNAAKEIVQLLDNSIKKVDETVQQTKSRVGALISENKSKLDLGISTANTCGKILDSVEVSSDTLKQVIAEVATASQEQARGVEEIAKAMNQLDQVTQSNSTSANQGADVATQLNQQTLAIDGFVNDLTTLVTGASSNRSASENQAVVGRAKTLTLRQSDSLPESPMDPKSPSKSRLSA